MLMPDDLLWGMEFTQAYLDLNLGFGKRLYLIIKGNFDSLFSNLSPGGSHKSYSNPSAGNVQS